MSSTVCAGNGDWSLHVTAAGAYIAQSASIGNALAQAKHIRAEAAGAARLDAAIGRCGRKPQAGEAGWPRFPAEAAALSWARSFPPVASRARLLLIHSFMVRREVCGTSTKRIPTRPDESCHTTSPDKPDRGFFSRQIELKVNLAAWRQPALGLDGQSILAQVQKRGRHILRVGVRNRRRRVQSDLGICLAFRVPSDLAPPAGCLPPVPRKPACTQ